MSLQVWLPLDGNLNNQGLSNVSVQSSTDISVDNNGKIGKCYNFPGNATNNLCIKGYDIPNNIEEYSIAFWAKTTSTNPIGCVFSNRTAVSDTQRTIFLYGSKRFLFDEGSRWDVTITEDYDPTNWTHYVFTKNDKYRRIYVNGRCVANKNVSSSSTSHSADIFIGSSQTSATTSNGNQFSGKLNDYRIYDHCLSEKEVKEISNGLVVHYKLDNGGWGNPNLMPNSIDMMLGTTNATTGTWRLAGSNTMTRERILIEDSPIGRCYGFQNSGQQTNAGDASCYEINGFPRVNGKTYTASFYARVKSGAETGQAGFAFYNATYISGTDTKKWASYYMTEIGREWKRCVFTFISTTNSANIYIGVGTDGADSVIQICGFKMEEGSIATSWCPHTSDTAAAVLGMNAIIEPDCSGYGNDGTIVGTLTTEGGSPRYKVSKYFNGQSYIKGEEGRFTWFDFKNFTIAGWMKPNSVPTGYVGSIGVQHDGATANLYAVISNYAGSFRFQYINGAYQSIDSGKRLPIGEWHHCAVTQQENIVKLYFDGQLVKSISIDLGTCTVRSDTRVCIGVDIPGGDEIYTGNISDVRIYTTVLSEDDIRQLFQTSASIDNNGNMYCYALEEV